MYFAPIIDFRDFCAAPRLIAPQPLRHQWRAWAMMVALYFAGLIILGVALAQWARVLHLPAAEAFSGYGPVHLAVIVIAVAPAAEETLFRGWLTGRPRALWLLAMAMLAGALAGAILAKWHEQATGLAIIATAIAAPVGWWMLCRRVDPPRLFARRFGAWFYVSVTVFGLSHLANYPRVSWALVPMVLPQIWAGMVYGYLRMRFGLPASILAHATGNAALLATALLASR